MVPRLRRRQIARWPRFLTPWRVFQAPSDPDILVTVCIPSSTAALISAYSQRDSRVRLMAHERGPERPVPVGILRSSMPTAGISCSLILDDLLAPFCVEQRIAVMEANPGADFAIFPMLLFHGDVGNADRFWNVDNGEDELLRFLHLDPICQGIGALWRRDSFVRVPMGDERLRILQDVELHLRAFAASRSGKWSS